MSAVSILPVLLSYNLKLYKLALPLYKDDS